MIAACSGGPWVLCRKFTHFALMNYSVSHLTGCNADGPALLLPTVRRLIDLPVHR